jgi:molybdate transport system substrate-binding protein
MTAFQRGLFCLLLLAFAAPAVAQPRAAGAVVYAASSLTDVLNDAGDHYAALGHPRPVFIYAASSTLAHQIEQGADANLFFSADEDWMNYLARRHLIDARSRVSLLSNRLALIAPLDRPIHLRIAPNFALHAALAGGHLAMADPDSVPAGRYGRAALERLGVWASVQGDVVRAENVRAALRFVQTGEAAAAIVYATDASAAGAGVAIVGVFPANSHPPISYPLAIVAGHSSAESVAFARYLRSLAAHAIFRRYGFGLR